MINIELTDEMIKDYNSNKPIKIYDCESVNLFLTKDRLKIYSFREGRKKFGCYLLTPKDRDALNKCETIFFYNGVVKIYLKKIGMGDLK